MFIGIRGEELSYSFVPDAEGKSRNRPGFGSQHVAYSDVIRNQGGCNTEATTSPLQPTNKNASQSLTRLEGIVNHVHDVSSELRGCQARECERQDGEQNHEGQVPAEHGQSDGRDEIKSATDAGCVISVRWRLEPVHGRSGPAQAYTEGKEQGRT